MAYMVPDTIPRLATAGERILFQTLRDYLPSDYIVYYEPEIQGRRPDFVVIGPDLGLVVLEVKDYTRNTLHEINQDEWTLHTSKGELAVVKNPLKQARDNVRHLAEQLKKDKNLIQLEGKYTGHLKFPYGFGAVFTRMKQEEFVRYDLYQVIPPEFVLCRDEVDPEEEGFSQENLVEKLLGMFTVWSRRSYRLTREDIKAIRYHLFPEVRIGAGSVQPAYYQDQLLLSLHNIKTMDLHQENLAKQLGDRHRLIRGVAGSGKTIVLASRAKMLAKLYPDWNILVLCYGIPLSRRLRQMIDQMLEEPDDLFDLIRAREETSTPLGSRIEVYNFHEWLRNKLHTKEEHIPALLDKLERKEAILPTYDAILIDEGQDFESSWLRLLGQVLNPVTQSLLLVEDRAQSIFKRKNSLAQDTGLDFRGRSKILTINYRNTAQIVQFAWDFYRKHSQLQNKVKLGTAEGVEIIPPQSTRRRGPEPRIIRCRSFVEEMQDVAMQIELLHRERHMPYEEMLILYRVKNNHMQSFIDDIQGQLRKSGIPHTWMTESPEAKRSFSRQEETVKISTIDSAKGLDFRAVFIVNIESMPFALEENEEREVSLFYIGMTRALEWLSLSYSGDSKFTKYLDEVRTAGEQRRDKDRGMG
ncbi:Type III restriction enzyme, res subunit [Paenibacillus sp. UNCCL117]|uniref:3'-5' exonuclease n=1 Tax=unclassified Paenibacillus TaxID=185978 RepID=UPI00089054F3|nr:MULTISPECIES: nuclease-related domain-containing DEAD/DEAH box helicase [unclassified Paenibacillus]SDE45980.1 Type III restriction enzyme, res subunit [Paenibacillus sp. cl123]SFW65964.1 Type III restriction enzyme, res subunit [Paenibacillus sp. UNCCL117]